MAEPGSARFEAPVPSLRTVLLLVNLVVLLLPVGGFLGLRVYENELLHQTEVELVAQGAMVSAMYREQALGLRRGDGQIEAETAEADDAPLDPKPARLDITTAPVWPLSPPAQPASQPAEADAARIGAALTPILRAANRMTLAGIRVVDRAAVVVATSGSELGMDLGQRPEVRRALQGEDVRLLRERLSDEAAPPLASVSRGTPVRIFVAMPVEVQGEVVAAVVLSRTPLTLTKALYRDRFSLLLAAAALVLSVVAVSLLTSLTIARPVRALIRQSRSVARGEVGAAQPLERPGTSEVAELSEALSHMATTLSQRAAYIQAFATSVSHEFKTPLTSMRGTVELLEDHLEGMDPDERGRFLAMLSADVARLERLVRALLELARADVLRPTEATTGLGPALASAARRAREQGLQVDDVAAAGEVAMAAQTLDAIVTNLLDNARRHGATRAQLQVREPDDGAPGAPPAGCIAVQVSDDGPGVSAANAEHIFDAFFTTARASGGTGLGLAISRALARAHQGDVRLLASPSGACFQLILQKAPLSR